jgi:hypothetical protein
MRRLLGVLTLILAGCSAVPQAAPQVTPQVVEQTESQRLLEVVARALARDLPAKYAVNIRFEHIPGPYLGLTYEGSVPGSLVVEIESRLDPQSVMDVLIHEWAHVVVWDVIQSDPHDELWGVAYSRSYRCARAAIDAEEQGKDQIDGLRRCR